MSVLSGHIVFVYVFELVCICFSIYPNLISLLSEIFFFFSSVTLRLPLDSIAVPLFTFRSYLTYVGGLIYQETVCLAISSLHNGLRVEFKEVKNYKK